MATKGPSLRLTSKRNIALAEMSLSDIEEAVLPEATRTLLGKLLDNDTVLDLALRYKSGQLQVDYAKLAEGNSNIPIVAQMMSITRDALLATFKKKFGK